MASDADGSVLSDGERLAWLRLYRTDRVGPIMFRDLLRLTGSASAALKALPELARRAGRKRMIPCPEATALAELEALARLGGRLIARGEPLYPAPLAAIPDPPPVISVLGDPALLSGHCVAMVGARNASALGRRFAHTLARSLGTGGCVIASGLARGIDTAAHEGALATGTVAVVGGGLDVIYPPENETLQTRIGATGAIVSEQPLGTVPRARHFPRRNRIISGLALGTVVVEATLRSGSLITARMALEQGRDVFAVPGSPMDPRHRGTNALIRDGAILTERAEDVLEAINQTGPTTRPSPRQLVLEEQLTNGPIAFAETTEDDHDRVLAMLDPDPVAVDELVRQCQLTPSQVLSLLLELEIAGKIRRHGGGRISLEIADI